MTTFEGPPLHDAAGIGALTLPGFLHEVADRYGPREALVLDDALSGGVTTRWTYDDLLLAARQVGRALVAAGIAPGDPVAIWMGSRPEAVAALFGAALAGALAVPVSTFATPPELAAMLSRSGAVAVLTQERLLARHPGDEVDGLRPDLPALRTVATLATPSWHTFLEAGLTVAAADLDERAAEVVPDDPGLVIFTSGTTAEPKGIVHGHRSPCLQFWVQAGIFGRTPDSRVFSALPLFWTAGLNTALGSTLAAGGCVVLQEVFEPGSALALLARERVTEPYTLPHQTAALAEHPDWAGTDLSSLRCVYGKGAYARHPSVHGDTGWIMPVGYGLSETCAFVSAHPCTTSRDDAKVGMGHLLPGVRARVLDPDTGRALRPGQEGEIAVAGPTLMQGYLGRPASDTFDADGFFATGDLGLVDAGGVLHFLGRRTEMIKTAGANVSPAELEVALRACPGVKLSRVVGVPDDRFGEVVVACIVPTGGATTTADDVRQFLRPRVAAYKVPRHVLFLADGEMPMTTGATKVRDDALVALVQARLAGAPPSGTAPPATVTTSVTTADDTAPIPPGDR